MSLCAQMGQCDMEAEIGWLVRDEQSVPACFYGQVAEFRVQYFRIACVVKIKTRAAQRKHDGNASSSHKHATRKQEGRNRRGPTELMTEGKGMPPRVTEERVLPLESRDLALRGGTKIDACLQLQPETARNVGFFPGCSFLRPATP